VRPVHFAAARRTPIGKLRGVLSSVRPDDLAAHVIRALVADVPALDPARIDDVYWGAANQAGEDNRNVARMAALLAGLPESVPGATVNRLCASGLEAVRIFQPVRRLRTRPFRPKRGSGGGSPQFRTPSTQGPTSETVLTGPVACT
jgi:hypothetical protein